MDFKVPNRILPGIVLSQFMCTSVWFAVNAVLPQLSISFRFPDAYLSHLTSLVQLGFISGTLVFAVFTIADRFSPARVFFFCAWAAALFNLGALFPKLGISGLMTSRFLVGFFLAGIYPVGMKIAADFYQKGLGTSLGYLVGALVLGTAFPHLIKGFSTQLPWENVVYATSLLSIVGGSIMLLGVGNGPFRRLSTGVAWAAFFKVFKNRPFRKAAFGYFGHMWELYAFWAIVPLLLIYYEEKNHPGWTNLSVLSFLIIGIGMLSCIAGGYLSKYWGEKKVASISLWISGSCCLLYPLVAELNSDLFFLFFMCLWGCSVIADSPMFSTLVAQNAQPQLKGTALTIVNSTGFAITIVSIQLLGGVWNNFGAYSTLLLGIGPALGLWLMKDKHEATQDA